MRLLLKNINSIRQKMFLKIYSNKGGDIMENVANGETLTDANNRVSNIIAVDLKASNCVIHVTINVVLPP